uniref:Probable U2 small nuclear ribonucleoprotein A' n=1 Tax=Syphacia muris TaxID=451379 RepID=A0A0N5ALQ0_9BILA
MEHQAVIGNVDDYLAMEVEPSFHRYPHCIVWTPIPMLTWLFPLIGHMGIATSKGIIRDFAGSYYVGSCIGGLKRGNEDNMGFGWPTRYWQLYLDNASGGAEAWDRAVQEAADEYKTHAHNLFCDNCHSFVALALNKMQYAGRNNYNMVYLALVLLWKGRYVGSDVSGVLKQWIPFLLVVGLYIKEKICVIQKMVRLTTDLIDSSPQYINTLRDRELSLRACKIPVLENVGATMASFQLIDKFDTIDFTDNDIRKLENIPLLKRLSCLLLHNNRVHSNSASFLFRFICLTVSIQIMPNLGEVLPSLRTLALTNNNLCELGDIDPLSTCKKLEYLTLIGNPLTHKPQYRSYVIYKVPSVRVLDFKRVRLNERQEAAKLFKGKGGRKLREQVVKTSAAIADDDYTNAPRKLLDEDARKIKAAIESASSLAEVEYLQNILQSGRIPEKGWKYFGARKDQEDQQMNGYDEFVEEHEDEREVERKNDDVPLANEENTSHHEEENKTARNEAEQREGAANDEPSPMEL